MGFLNCLKCPGFGFVFTIDKLIHYVRVFALLRSFPVDSTFSHTTIG